jgi:hypothetical protein
MGAMQPGEHGLHLPAREHHRQPCRPLRPQQPVQLGKRKREHVPVEEDECVERLVLRGRGDVLLRRRVGEERGDVGGAELGRVPLPVMDHVAAHPVDVRLLGGHGPAAWVPTFVLMGAV